MRTDLPKLLQGPTDVIVDLLGPKVSAILANALRDGANIYGAAAMKSLSKLLRCNFVTSTVMTFVLSASDIRNAFCGRISVKQLIKNITTVGGGIAGGIVGVAAGQAILGLATGGASTLVSGAVAAVSGMAGGMAGSSGAHALVGQFVEDDAVEMTRLIEDAFCRQAQEYLLNQDELEIALDELNMKLTGEKLLDMYASPDHEAYAEQFVKEIRLFFSIMVRIFSRITRLLMSSGFPVPDPSHIFRRPSPYLPPDSFFIPVLIPRPAEAAPETRCCQDPSFFWRSLAPPFR